MLSLLPESFLFLSLRTLMIMPVILPLVRSRATLSRPVHHLHKATRRYASNPSPRS
jgi:hypothetical protein